MPEPHKCPVSEMLAEPYSREHVLGLVSRFAQPVLQLFPQRLELRPMCPGSFPRVRILQLSAADKLLEMVAIIFDILYVTGAVILIRIWQGSFRSAFYYWDWLVGGRDRRNVAQKVFEGPFLLILLWWLVIHPRNLLFVDVSGHNAANQR